MKNVRHVLTAYSTHPASHYSITISVAEPFGPNSPAIFLRKWREHRRLTQRELAQRIGIKPVEVSRWENGVRSINLNVLTAIARSLGVQTNDLYQPPNQRAHVGE